MRKLLIVTLLMVLGTEVLAINRAKMSPPARVDTNLLVQDDRFVPWPMSVRRTFPWTMMEGTWLAQNGEFQSYYTFKITRDGQIRHFEVRQIDVMTCQEVANGHGSATRGQSRITAEMFYINVRQSYGFFVRSYQYAGPMKDIGVNPIEGQVVMLYIQPEDRTDYVHFVISKLSNDSSASFCKGKN